MTQHPGPLSLAQEGLWFLDRLTPRSAAYNLVTGARFGGLLDAAALGRALDAIVQRHEVLRTHVEVLDGRPVQRVRSGVGSGLIVDDLADLSTSEWERAADQITAEDLARPFDLETGPLLRARLLRLDQRRHRLIVVMHHIVTDGTSMGVFWDELSALYGAHIGGRSAPEPRLPNLPLQYLDYAAWQRERLDRGEYNAGLAYWRSALSGAPSVLDLPLDRPIPATRSFAAAAHRWTLRADIVDKLGHLCAREGATRFMGLLAAFAVVLGRYADRDDLLIGCPVSGRTRTELEGLIGLFANTLPLRIDLSGASFRELLGRVRTTALGGYTHQDVPFELLVSELAPPRSPQQHPLVQVMAVLHQAPLGTPRLAGLTAEPVALRARTAKADLSLLIRGTAGDLEASLEYDAEIFEPGTVRRLAVRLERLIKIIVAEPDRPVHKIDLRSPAERRATAQWNRTRVPSQNRWLHETVAAKAAAEPDAVAVRHGDRVLTYGDLDRRANRLAHRLVAGGAGRGTVLAVCMTRSPSLVIAFLAILKTGATYLPLDPALPAKRLHWMLADARATLLLGGTDVADRLPAYGCSVVTEEDQEDGSDGEKSRPLQTRDTNEPDPLEQAPITQLTPEDTAYIIYTSGSTGTPKGVALPQRGLRNVVEAQAKVFGITPTDRVLQFASPGFDAAIFEMALALGAGAQLCLIDADVAVPGPALLEVLRRQEITYVTLPPSVLALLPEGDLPHLHTVSVAGEPCRSPLVRRWARGRRMFNLYGPTEATIWSTFAACDPDALTAADPPIGRPIGNTTVQVVDQDLRPVPIGTPGELLIGGPGVATGYLNQPELTAEKFLPDPANPRHRLYRTGDLVRWRPDGNLTYHGRLDRQFKIRGYRIEPGEIETALTRHPAIRHAHVTTHKPHHAAAPQLTAYVMPTDTHARPSPAELRHLLAGEVAPHLIPSRFVFVDRIPLTPNAKIDEAALLRLDAVNPAPAPAWAPRTAPERLLARLWMEVVGLERLTHHGDFFSQGGDSLRAVALLARVRDATGIELGVRAFLQRPSLAGLVEQLCLAALRTLPEQTAGRLLDQIEQLQDDGIEEQ
jgi:amino acid adenylation domain-containing protein